MAIVTGAALTAGQCASCCRRRSLDFWTRLAGGETGLGHSLIYYTNQSVFADVVRAFRLAPYAARSDWCCRRLVAGARRVGGGAVASAR